MGQTAVTDKRRELHLNAFLMEAGHHEASWRRPDSNPRADFDLDNWIGLALALRGTAISDFPICNKSFNLSYCGFDL